MASKANHFFSPDQVNDFKSVFEETDEDKSGFVEHGELKSIIQKCGVECNDKQIEDLVKEMDEDGNGKLDFKEFLTLMWRLQSGPSERELRNEMFSLLDDDMDGFVNFEELKASFIKVAEMSKGEVKVPSDALLKQMIAEASSEGGNQISFDDFGALMDVLPAPQAAAAGL